MQVWLQSSDRHPLRRALRSQSGARGRHIWKCSGRLVSTGVLPFLFVRIESTFSSWSQSVPTYMFPSVWYKLASEMLLTSAFQLANMGWFASRLLSVWCRSDLLDQLTLLTCMWVQRQLLSSYVDWFTGCMFQTCPTQLRSYMNILLCTGTDHRIMFLTCVATQLWNPEMWSCSLSISLMEFHG